MTDKERIKDWVKNLKSQASTIPSLGINALAGFQLACDDVIAFINSLPEEPASEDLEEAAVSIIKRLGGMEKDDCVSEHELKIFKAAIDWQKKRDQETIELAEDHAMLAGMNKMKDEMMENAVDAEVFTDYNINFGYGSLTANIDLDEQHLKEGDKVKIIIVKED